MSLSFDECVAVALAPHAARTVGARKDTPTFAVYRLPEGAARERMYRFGRHPARANDLARQFGDCEVVHVFLAREQAETVARHLNALPAAVRERERAAMHSAGLDTAAAPHPAGQGDAIGSDDTSPAADVQATMMADGGWVTSNAAPGAASRRH